MDKKNLIGENNREAQTFWKKLLDSPIIVLFIGKLIDEEEGFQTKWRIIFILFLTNLIQEQILNFMES